MALDDAHAWIAARRATREPWQRADGTIAAMRPGDAPPEALATGAGGRLVARQHELAATLGALAVPGQLS